MKRWGCLALLVLTCACMAVLLRPSLASNKNRALRASENGQASVYKGEVTVDFYRLFEEKRWLGIIPYKDYTISKSRMAGQLFWMNYWFDGRVDFILGDIYEIDDSFYYDNPSEMVCGNALIRFAARASSGGQDQINNVDRINVLVVPKLGQNINGCASGDVPLGGSLNYKAPAFALTRDNTFFYSIGPLVKIAFQNLFGYVAGHEAGHIFGLLHTSMPGDVAPQVMEYSGCGLNLRYPQFSNEQLLSGDFTDEVSGELYTYADWHGQSNIMSSIRSIATLFIWKAGIFRYNYEPIFDQILECWFSRSSMGTASDAQGMDETKIIENR
ncbi:expressed unknown protein [Seminavis robusta]|uniref:Peptidase M10 metallopeptidase domain-containing protein n=1 Tax=Seminavis robusta TaxID=568900 RepID=A0A9N8DQG5_9STRA|nr:expressed unknown protein [Seminavis robusta]|eukprot:Sro266_g103240.1 n/a (328) ;mRNA; r:54646-55629